MLSASMRSWPQTCLQRGVAFPGFLFFVCSLARCLAPAPLELRPYGAMQICFIIIIIFLAHQHKACRQLKIKQEMTAVGD